MDPWQTLQGVWESLTGKATPQAAASVPEEAPPPKPLPFYPSRRYIEKGQTPETSLTEDAVTSIAQARKLAETSGVLSPDLGAMLLPIAMTEGWGTGMGVKSGEENSFYASPRFKAALKNMGLEEYKDVTPIVIRGEKHYIPEPRSGNEAKMAAVILGEKAAVARARGDTTIEGAVKRYNGKGSSWERYYGANVPANVNTYWKKVQEAHQLLEHPMNAPFVSHFNSIYQAP